VVETTGFEGLSGRNHGFGGFEWWTSMGPSVGNHELGGSSGNYEFGGCGNHGPSRPSGSGGFEWCTSMGFGVENHRFGGSEWWTSWAQPSECQMETTGSEGSSGGNHGSRRV
jgi:hypothetical protein